MAPDRTWLSRMLGKAGGALLPKTWKGKLVLYGIPALLLLALLDPVFGLVHKVFDLVERIATPFLETTIGRILALLIAMAGGASLAAWLLRDRVRSMRGHAMLGRHFDATAALLVGDSKRARDLLRAICRRKRVRPDEYPWIAEDASLKLARLSLAEGRAAEALRWVARVSSPELPEELARSRAQLRIEALRLHGGALPETLLSEAEAACSAHPTCARLHAELRELRVRRGDWMGAFEAQQRVVANAAPASLSAEQETLCRDATTASARAIADGDVDAAKKLQRAIAKLPGPTAGLLQGDILAHKGDFRGAVRAWGQTASPEGLDRIAALLQNAPVEMDPRELLACCPMQGMVLLLARELARRGQADDALRAARHAAETLGPTTTVCLVLAETLDRLGQTERSQRLAEQAAQLLLQPASPRESVPPQQQPPKLS